jgi:hypothetical protein
MVSIEIMVTSDTATPLLERIKEALGLAAQARLRLGARASYASFVEFGTRRMAAQPFIRPAVDAYFNQLVQGVAEGALQGDVLAAFEEAGSNMEDLARGIVPVDTGYLQSTIFHEVK